jgi:hypothetical protein
MFVEYYRLAWLDPPKYLSECDGMQNLAPLIRQSGHRVAGRCVDDRIIVNLRYAPDCIARANRATAAEKLTNKTRGIDQLMIARGSTILNK